MRVMGVHEGKALARQAGGGGCLVLMLTGTRVTYVVADHGPPNPHMHVVHTGGWREECTPHAHEGPDELHDDGGQALRQAKTTERVGGIRSKKSASPNPFFQPHTRAHYAAGAWRAPLWAQEWPTGRGRRAPACPGRSRVPMMRTAVWTMAGTVDGWRRWVRSRGRTPPWVGGL